MTTLKLIMAVFCLPINNTIVSFNTLSLDGLCVSSETYSTHTSPELMEMFTVEFKLICATLSHPWGEYIIVLLIIDTGN